MPAPGYRLANYERYPVHGYWGPVTANIDWCESNYEVSFYVAEFWNTVTTLAMIAPPIYGGIRSLTKRHVEYRYLVPFVALIIVGLGSGLFHMTLLYEMQLMDELPMIWGTATMLYAIFEVNKTTPGFNYRLASLLFAGCTASTIAYLAFDRRFIFEGTYTAMVLWSIYLGIKAVIADKSLRRMFVSAFIFYLVGFILWSFDRLYCDELTTVRRMVPGSLGPFTQFHAWWHFFASFGTYLFIILCLRARLRILSKPSQLRYGFGIFPYYEAFPDQKNA